VTVLKDHFVSFEDRQHLFRSVRRLAKLAQSGDRLPLPFDQLARSLKITLCNRNRIIRHPARLRTRPLVIKWRLAFPVEGVPISLADRIALVLPREPSGRLDGLARRESSVRCSADWPIRGHPAFAAAIIMHLRPIFVWTRHRLRKRFVVLVLEETHACGIGNSSSGSLRG
jgi:hypothetical protein